MSPAAIQNSALRVRRAAPLDAGMLSELAKRCFYEAFAEDTAPDDMTAYLDATFKKPVIEAQIKAEGSLFLIAETDAAPAGYVYSYPTKPPACVRDSTAIQLIRLYLRKSHYRQALGSALMQSTLEQARSRGYRTIWLSSWKLNDRANAFYKRWQFRVVGEQNFTVGSDVQDDFIFSRKI